MFRPMRKKNKEIGTDAAKELLRCSRRGVLAVNGDDGYPYAIPINYLYEEETQKILFHGSKVGHKADALKNSDKVCFTVYGKEMIRDEAWAPYLQSIVVFGRCRPVEDREERLRLVKKFAMKFFPNEGMADEEVKKAGAAVQIYEIEIEHLSGKEIQEK